MRHVDPGEVYFLKTFDFKQPVQKELFSELHYPYLVVNIGSGVRSVSMFFVFILLVAVALIFLVLLVSWSSRGMENLSESAVQLLEEALFLAFVKRFQAAPLLMRCVFFKSRVHHVY